MIAPLLLALLPLQDSPELLPPLREGWRFERLELPLSFAPKLEYEGFEELNFAPGMFDPESESYFSYALCIRIDERVDVDPQFVEGFFTEYFRGLCGAVAESRGLDLDLARVSASVEDDGGGARRLLVVEMVDAFVTGEPVTLHIELDRRLDDSSVELLGLISPSSKDAPIWRDLRAIRAGWWKRRPLPVFLNHVYFVPDAETYEALKTSEFLTQELGAWEERTTVRKDMTYTGLYFYGQNTYFEFLHPDSGFPVGSTGIAFGVEAEGETERMTKALEEHELGSFPAPVTRELDGEQVPWFQMLGIQQASTTSKLQLFSLEYDPGFLASWHGDLPPGTRGIARREILERYASKLGQSSLRDDGLLEDVVTLFLDVDDTERAHLEEIGRAFGYSIDVGPGTGFLATTEHRVDGPGFRMWSSRASDSPTGGKSTGLIGIGLSLKRPVERKGLRLGKVSILFSGPTAWIQLGR